MATLTFGDKLLYDFKYIIRQNITAVAMPNMRMLLVVHKQKYPIFTREFIASISYNRA